MKGRPKTSSHYPNKDYYFLVSVRGFLSTLRSSTLFQFQSSLDRHLLRKIGKFYGAISKWRQVYREKSKVNMNTLRLSQHS
ncbi:CLUMA_CG001019, isoform A [Clunio marinus]|uniref:CLUMA_CG001019, isoform A n=1 Tax=Clunio marinus TaxID=568069 RepID=A0A1J1HGS6_9DIPT|nr:CLUMA_CG001019, isoform A [Clunio marinus]